MKSTKVQRFILYSLGRWFEEANEGLGEPLQVSISKVLFIEILLKAGIAKKQERALYRNLEMLEQRKLVAYKNRELTLTKKGETLFFLIKRELEPYFSVNRKLQEKSPTSYTKKVQTVFR